MASGGWSQDCNVVAYTAAAAPIFQTATYNGNRAPCLASLGDPSAVPLL